MQERELPLRLVVLCARWRYSESEARHGGCFCVKGGFVARAVDVKKASSGGIRVNGSDARVPARNR